MAKKRKAAGKGKKAAKKKPAKKKAAKKKVAKKKAAKKKTAKKSARKPAKKKAARRSAPKKSPAPANENHSEAPMLSPVSSGLAGFGAGATIGSAFGGGNHGNGGEE